MWSANFYVTSNVFINFIRMYVNLNGTQADESNKNTIVKLKTSPNLKILKVKTQFSANVLIIFDNLSFSLNMTESETSIQII
jgi:hypothetical protein